MRPHRGRCIRADWCEGVIDVDVESPILAIDDPGRPLQPLLVDPRKLEAAQRRERKRA